MAGAVDPAKWGSPEYVAEMARVDEAVYVVVHVAWPARSGWAAHAGTVAPSSSKATVPDGVPAPANGVATSATNVSGRPGTAAVSEVATAVVVGAGCTWSPSTSEAMGPAPVVRGDSAVTWRVYASPGRTAKAGSTTVVDPPGARSTRRWTGTGLEGAPCRSGTAPTSTPTSSTLPW